MPGTAWNVVYPAGALSPVRGQGPIAAPVPAGVAVRPAQVRLACVLTWVFSSLTALAYAAVLLALAVDKDRIVRELQKSPGWKASFDTDTVVAVLAVGSIAFLLWSLAAIVLAALVWRRVRWAWVALLVSAWLAGLVSIVSVVAFPGSLPVLAAIGVSAGLLMRRTTRAWFAGAEQRPQPPAPRAPLW